eukprot:g1437.t1
MNTPMPSVLGNVPSAAVPTPAGNGTSTGDLSFSAADYLVIITGLIGILFALYQYWQVSKITFDDLHFGGDNVHSPLNKNWEEEGGNSPAQQKSDLVMFYNAIREGAQTFLFAEYMYCAVFIVVFYIIILVLIAWGNKWNWTLGALTATSFAVGAVTSLLSGYIGMMVATYSNARTTIAASQPGERGWSFSFTTAFQAGAVMGFALCSLALLMLYLLLHIYRDLSVFTSINGTVLRWETLMECIAGYGLGGSSIAMFGRVGGGVYTKAADVGSDLAGKVHEDLPEDDPRNPGVIADNVGDNVGDVAGMGSDLFGSFGEATCAALLVGASSDLILEAGWNAITFPLLISAVGIPVCLVTSFFATHILPVKREKDVELALKLQLGISTALMTGALVPVCWYFLPSKFSFAGLTTRGGDHTQIEASPVHAFLSICFGLWGGCIIGFITEYYTSHSYEPTREVARSCETGAATNIIYGLALGYKSVILPVFILAATIFGSFKLCGMYGIALAALGMLGTLATCLSIDVYGPVCDNAGGIAEMSELHHSVRDKTDALDAAGNTTAAIGKGFAIGSAALVSLALFGAFVTRTSPKDDITGKETLRQIDVLNPITFAGLLVGAMLPYWFTAMTMKSVGSAASAMVNEIKRQWENPDVMSKKVKPDFQRCIDISTKASLAEMIAPGALVMLSPIVAGLFFGIDCVCGLLAGGMVSGVQMAISQSNTGGAWDNAKKYVGSKRLNDMILEREGKNANINPNGLQAADVLDLPAVDIDIKHKASDFYKAAVTGDTVGDPLKDTSGPALNILMKLMAIVSVVFAGAFLEANDGKGFFHTGT